METSGNLSDCDQSSSQEGESRPTSAVGSYEDDFERELEYQVPCSYDEDKLEPFELVSDKDGSIKWNGRDGAPVILDHAAYRDCDEDLENALTVAYTESMTESNGHFYLFKRDIDSEGLSSRGRRFLDIFRRRFKHYNSMKEKDNFFDAAEEVGCDSTPDGAIHESLQNMDPVQRARQEEEWRNELAKTEEEIQTLRFVLASKVRHAQDLKQKLGITVWKEFREDMEQGLKNVKDSDVLKNVNDRLSEIQQAIERAPLYQKTETAFKSAGEKTTAVLGTFSATVTKKLGEVKNSPTFKSFEEAVGSAYTNVKTKVSGSRSNSVQSFEEALANAEGRKSGGVTPASTPIIPEEKPLL